MAESWGWAGPAGLLAGADRAKRKAVRTGRRGCTPRLGTRGASPAHGKMAVEARPPRAWRRAHAPPASTSGACVRWLLRHLSRGHAVGVPRWRSSQVAGLCCALPVRLWALCLCVFVCVCVCVFLSSEEFKQPSTQYFGVGRTCFPSFSSSTGLEDKPFLCRPNKYSQRM